MVECTFLPLFSSCQEKWSTKYLSKLDRIKPVNLRLEMKRLPFLDTCVFASCTIEELIISKFKKGGMHTKGKVKEGQLKIASRNTWKFQMCLQLFYHRWWWWGYISENAINCNGVTDSSLWNLSPSSISTFKDNKNSSLHLSIPLWEVTTMDIVSFHVKFFALIVSHLFAVVWGQFSILQLSNSCQIKRPDPVLIYISCHSILVHFLA